MSELPNSKIMVPPDQAVAQQLEQEIAAGLEYEAKNSQKLAVAPPLQLMWWKFRKNRMAVVSAVVLLVFYATALLADFIAPYDPNAYIAKLTLVPPQRIHFTDENGNLTQPFVYGIKQEAVRDGVVIRRVFTEDPTRKYTLGFGVRDVAGNLRLFGTVDPTGDVYLFGGDDLGRDLFSRIIHALRISLSIGLIGVVLTMVLGIVIGGVTGFYGGWLDMVVQRIIEFLDAIPKIPLWLGLSAAIPLSWDPVSVYIGIVIILALLEWGGTARTVRSRFLALRDEDFVRAARVAGATESRIIFRHMLPSFYSHMIASVTLRIPGTILGETSLSFLGLGIKEPLISFGVLLQSAQNIRSVGLAPWLIIPAFFLIVLVLAYNYFGDGLRDAADPYAT
jgi:peptide/nickel transport system permease protein